MKPTFRALPSVDYLLSQVKGTDTPHNLAVNVCRQAIDEYRAALSNGSGLFTDEAHLQQQVLNRALALLAFAQSPGLQQVINATGIVLHTNLGRAPLSRRAQKALLVAANNCNLEYNLATGKRGNREEKIGRLLLSFTGAEDFALANNNAAAIFLVLDTLAKGQKLLISRGELVEIGGSFRVPDIIAKSGCQMAEVGTTNKTSLADYAKEAPDAAAILQVHFSNFQIRGFTSRPTPKELAKLAHEKGLLLIKDLGSGCLYPLREAKIGSEPLIKEEIANGTDIVTFSGDKLLGGPQAGIILGRKELITQIKANPLYRALRLDKLRLAALEATLEAYWDMTQAQEEIPVLNLLLQDEAAIKQKGEKLAAALAQPPGLTVKIEAAQAPVGGGALPEVILPTTIIKLKHTSLSSDDLALALRRRAIAGYINDGYVVLDMRTVLPRQLKTLAREIINAIN